MMLFEKKNDRLKSILISSGYRPIYRLDGYAEIQNGETNFMNDRMKST